MFFWQDLMKMGNFPQRRLTILGTMGSLSRYPRIYRKVLECVLLRKNLTQFFYECIPLFKMIIPLHRTLLVGTIVVAISAFAPLSGWGEVTPVLPNPKLHSEPVTFNYSLAIRGDHKKLPFKSQTALFQPEGPVRDPGTFPLMLNAQSSSSIQEYLQKKRQPGSSTFTIDEDVSSYIIHEPVLRNQEADVQEVNNQASPASDERKVKGQESTDSQYATAQSTGDFPFLTIAQSDRLPVFSRFHWHLVPELDRSFFTQGIPSPSPQIVLEPILIRLSKLEPVMTRYAHVFDPAWEPKKEDLSSDYGNISLVLNAAVEKNLKYFQEGIHDRFQTYLDRFHHYREIVEPIFREFGLPTELMYLSLVESGFNPRAYSRARASGPWQFMKATGRMYKLHVNWYVDERRDPIKSTVAAAHHLRDLYDRFGSWPLALGAYNAGSGKISRAIRKTKSRDFWKIRRTWHIRRETKDYVPRFIAATLIATNPTAYGFQVPDGDPHEFEEVLITKRVQLSAITKQTGISLKELKRLNPELRRNIVPISQGPGYHLKVPVGMASVVAAHHDALPVWTQPPPPPTQWYRVRRGDSLSVVARKFGMKVRQLKAMNHLSSNLIRAGKKLRVRTGVDDEIDRTATWYRVRYGDSLGRIANRFGTSVRKLKRLNSLSTHLIYPGDRLRVRGTSAPQKTQTGESKWYRVRRGDSLWTIARQFSVSVRNLRTLNNLSSSIIRAGHMLMVSQ